MRACTHTPRERASERGERERERERERGRERSRERERARAFCLKCVLLITLLAPGKHTPTDPASSAPDTRCRCALPKPCNAAPRWTRPRRHRVHPSARHPRPLDPGPRMPPPQRRRVPARHRTVPRPRAWDARASTAIGATAARPRAPKPSRRKRPAAPQPATAATHSPQPPPRPPPERRPPMYPHASHREEGGEEAGQSA